MTESSITTSSTLFFHFAKICLVSAKVKIIELGLALKNQEKVNKCRSH